MILQSAGGGSLRIFVLEGWFVEKLPHLGTYILYLSVTAGTQAPRCCATVAFVVLEI